MCFASDACDCRGRAVVGLGHIVVDAGEVMGVVMAQKGISWSATTSAVSMLGQARPARAESTMSMPRSFFEFHMERVALVGLVNHLRPGPR
jgi:hypothetical protein